MSFEATRENEEVIISLALLDNTCVGQMQRNHKIEAYKFHDTTLGTIYAVIQLMIYQGLEADLQSVTSYMLNNNYKKTLGNGAIERLAEINGKAISNANMDYYAKIFADNWRKRQAEMLLANATEKLNGMPAELETVLSELSRGIREIEDESCSADIYSGDRLRNILNDDLKFNIEHKGQFIGVPTGLYKLDVETRGFRGGELITLAAIAGGGKSAMADTMIYNILSNGYKAALFSLEMPKEQILERLVSISTGIPLADIRNGNLTDEQLEAIRGSRTYFDENFFLVDTPLIDYDALASLAYQLVNVNHVQIIFIDYIQLVRKKAKGNKQSYELLTELADDIKALAKRLNIPVVVLSQLNTKGYEEIPDMNNLGGGLALTKSSDYILLLYKEKNENGEEQTKLRMAKARNTNKIQFPLNYDKQRLYYSVK